MDSTTTTNNRRLSFPEINNASTNSSLRLDNSKNLGEKSLSLSYLPQNNRIPQDPNLLEQKANEWRLEKEQEIEREFNQYTTDLQKRDNGIFDLIKKLKFAEELLLTAKKDSLNLLRHWIKFVESFQKPEDVQKVKEEIQEFLDFQDGQEELQRAIGGILEKLKKTEEEKLELWEKLANKNFSESEREKKNNLDSLANLNNLVNDLNKTLIEKYEELLSGGGTMGQSQKVYDAKISGISRKIGEICHECKEKICDLKRSKWEIQNTIAHRIHTAQVRMPPLLKDYKKILLKSREEDIIIQCQLISALQNRATFKEMENIEKYSLWAKLIIKSSSQLRENLGKKDLSLEEYNEKEKEYFDTIPKAWKLIEKTYIESLITRCFKEDARLFLGPVIK